MNLGEINSGHIGDYFAAGAKEYKAFARNPETLNAFEQKKKPFLRLIKRHWAGHPCGSGWSEVKFLIVVSEGSRNPITTYRGPHRILAAAVQDEMWLSEIVSRSYLLLIDLINAPVGVEKRCIGADWSTCSHIFSRGFRAIRHTVATSDFIYPAAQFANICVSNIFGFFRP